MSLRINYFNIGLFVIIAIALLLAGTVYWGADTFSRQVRYIETCFDETVQGLSIGSPVNFRGVQVGKIEEITLAFNRYPEIKEPDKRGKFGKYVIIVIGMMANRATVGDNYMLENLPEMIKDGLRLRIVTQPLTGIGYIEADYLDPALNPQLEIAWEPLLTYIPSASSLMNKFSQTAERAFARLSEIDFAGLINKADLLLSNLNQVVTDARISDVSAETIATIKDFGQLSQAVRAYLKTNEGAPPQATLEDVMVSLNRVLNDFDSEMRKAQVDKVSGDVQALVNELRETNRKLQGVIQTSPGQPRASLEEVLASVRDSSDQLGATVTQNQPEITRLMDNLVQISEQLKSLVQDMQAHPGRTIFSEPPQKTELNQ